MLKPKKDNGRWQVPPFDEASSWKKSMRYMTDEAPLVRINVKKQSGGTSITNSVLKSYINDYADEIIEQINIYDANILFCCGPGLGVAIRRLIKERILPDLEMVSNNEWMYYSQSNKILVVDGYHPSCRKSHEEIYNNLKDAYEDFLNKSDFIKEN